MKCGISSACLYPQVTEEAVAYLAAHSVENIEIFFNAPSELEMQYLHSLKQVLDAAGTHVVSIHPFSSGFEPYMFFTNYVRRYEDILDLYKRYFEAMQYLGARIFVFHGDRSGSRFPENDYFERFSGLQAVGHSYGVTVAQENVERCRSRDPQFLARMKEAIPDAEFVLDVKQAVRSGYSPFSFIDAIGDRLSHLHVSDHRTGADCLPIGEGNFDFDRFFSRLQTLSYDGYLILELYRQNFDTPEQLLGSLKKLQSWKKDVL